ncbi:MAG: hypothetical protein ACK40S_07325 [Burkholderiaceae bacterium]
MKRGIGNKRDLIASLAVQAYDKAIWAAGGYELTGKPNRETRRRMEQEARRAAKKISKKLEQQ